MKEDPIYYWLEFNGQHFHSSKKHLEEIAKKYKYNDYVDISLDIREGWRPSEYKAIISCLQNNQSESSKSEVQKLVIDYYRLPSDLSRDKLIEFLGLDDFRRLVFKSRYNKL